MRILRRGATDLERRVRPFDSERQEEALRYFASSDRLLVTGPAGTGKTNIAVRAAQLQANRDERVLLTCFNTLLEADPQARWSMSAPPKAARSLRPSGGASPTPPA